MRWPESLEVVDDEMAEVLRQKTGAERLRIAFGMFSAARREDPEARWESTRELYGAASRASRRLR